MQFRLIPAVEAQSIDAVAQPTFGPLVLSNTPGGANNVQIVITSTQTTVANGNTFKVSIELKTGTDISVDEYQLVLKYNPQRLTVKDKDTGNSGVQSTLTDTLFTIPTPVSNNNYASTTAGLIFIRAKGNYPVTINRKVFEIEFQAQSLGVSEISVDTTPIDGTRIKRGATDIAYNPSSLTINVNQDGQAQSCTQSTDCPTGQICLSNGQCGVQPANSCNFTADCSQGHQCVNGQCVENVACSSNADCSAGKQCISGACRVVQCTTDAQCANNFICIDYQCIGQTASLPRTGIADNFGSALAVVAAVILIGFGIYLRRYVKPE